jgi:hypothetical protein
MLLWIGCVTKHCEMLPKPKEVSCIDALDIYFIVDALDIYFIAPIALF